MLKSIPAKITLISNIHITLFNTKKSNNVHKKTHQILTIRMKNHYTNNFHKNHYTNNFYKNHHTNITRINIFVVINQINKHKARIYNHCMYT